MFAGIVEGTGRVAQADRSAIGMRLRIDLGPLAEGLTPGASVAVNGVCLTLVDLHGSVAAFDVVLETLRLTNLGRLQTGQRVNLERSLRVGDRIDGHFVQGHIDGCGTVAKVERGSGDYLVWVRVDEALSPYIVRKGSVAVDGVSLTVVDAGPDWFCVALIPTTLERTVLGERRPGDTVNIETDILARLVVSRLAQMSAPPDPKYSSLTLERLRDAGFA